MAVPLYLRSVWRLSGRTISPDGTSKYMSGRFPVQSSGRLIDNTRYFSHTGLPATPEASRESHSSSRDSQPHCHVFCCSHPPQGAGAALRCHIESVLLINGGAARGLARRVLQSDRFRSLPDLNESGGFHHARLDMRRHLEQNPADTEAQRMLEDISRELPEAVFSKCPATSVTLSLLSRPELLPTKATRRTP